LLVLAVGLHILQPGDAVWKQRQRRIVFAAKDQLDRVGQLLGVFFALALIGGQQSGQAVLLPAAADDDHGQLLDSLPALDRVMQLVIARRGEFEIAIERLQQLGQAAEQHPDLGRVGCDRLAGTGNCRAHVPQIDPAQRRGSEGRFPANIVKRRPADFLPDNRLVGHLNFQLQLEQLLRPRAELVVAPLPRQLVAKCVEAIAHLGAERRLLVDSAGGAGDKAVAGTFGSEGCHGFGSQQCGLNANCKVAIANCKLAKSTLQFAFCSLHFAIA
jgi:hypothetical protein